LIKPGERFVYYRGRKTLGLGTRLQVYLGAGIVGRVSNSPDRPDRLACQILDYRPFSEPVPFKDSDGTHLELAGRRKGFYQQGVRRIDEGLFERIASYGKPRWAPPEANYTNPELGRKVEDYALQVAKLIAAERFPQLDIVTQPRCQPRCENAQVAPV